MPSLFQPFSQPLLPSLRTYLVGQATATVKASSLYLATHATSVKQYCDAQIDDYAIGQKQRFRWSPPLRLLIQARFSHPIRELQGTAGFGFWNYPFHHESLALPQAVWFFYASPPSNLALDLHTPGWGWKVATLDAKQPYAPILAGLSPLFVLLMNNQTLYPRLWGMLQRLLRIQERSIPYSMTDWHIYALDWRSQTVCFSVDGQFVLRNAPAPQGPLSFVAWLDNQYAVVTPQGRLGWGLLANRGEQWLELAWLMVEEGARRPA